MNFSFIRIRPFTSFLFVLFKTGLASVSECDYYFVDEFYPVLTGVG